MRVEVLDTLADLRRHAPAWNELWQASDVSLPTCRAETLALWLEQFAPGARLQIVLVWQGDRLAAALPTYGARLKGLVSSARMPIGPWGASGDVLMARDVDESQAAAALAARLMKLPWPLLWWDGVRYREPRWQALLAAAEEHGLLVAVQHQSQNGVVDFECDWAEYQSRWSRNHRRAVKRAAERAAERGDVGLRLISPDSGADPAEVEALVQRGFEVEDRSWKGAAGTSVLRSPGMLDYYFRQARLLASWEELDLAFLEINGQPIAFEYAPRGKGMYFAAKVGYDEAFEDLTPGQLLRARLFEQMIRERSHVAIDFAGILVESTAKWSTRSIDVGRVILAQRSPMGRLAAAAYKKLLPHWQRRQAQKGLSTPPVLEPGAAPRARAPVEA